MYDDAVADEARALRVDEAAGKHVEVVGDLGLIARRLDDDRVARVVPAGAPRADVRLGRQDVRQLALALVAP